MLRPHVGDTVLEVGAGIGNITGRLMGRRLQYMAAEKDPLHLHALRNRFLRTPNVCVRPLDPAAPSEFADLADTFDYRAVPERARISQRSRSHGLRALRRAEARRVAVGARSAKPGALRRHRSQAGARAAISGRRAARRCSKAPAFGRERVYQLNKIGALAWRLYGGLLHRQSDQQGDFEAVRQVGLVLAPRGFRAAMERALADRRSAQTRIDRRESALQSLTHWSYARLFRHAICNEVYEKRPFAETCRAIRAAGYTGIEIAPFTLDEDPASIPAGEAARIRRGDPVRGARVRGLALVAGQSERTARHHARQTRCGSRSWEHLRKLVDLCADLGPRGVMVFGSPKQRSSTGGLAPAEATRLLTEGLADLAPHALERGVTILLEALPPSDTDVVTSLDEAARIVREIGSEADAHDVRLSQRDRRA